MELDIFDSETNMDLKPIDREKIEKQLTISGQNSTGHKHGSGYLQSDLLRLIMGISKAFGNARSANRVF